MVFDESERGTPTAVSAVGLVLLGVVGLYLASTHLPMMLGEQDHLLLTLQFIELVFLVVPGSAITVLGVMLPPSLRIDQRDDHHGNTSLWWTVGGVVLLVFLAGGINVHRWMSGSLMEWGFVTMELLSAAGIGGLLGLILGLNTERLKRRTAEVQEQRDSFAFLNRTLRHHILNGTNVIDGYTGRLRETIDDEHHNLIEPIEQRSRSIAYVVRNVGAIAETFTGERPQRHVDVVELVSEEVAAARHAYPAATFDIDLEGVAYIEADGTFALAVKSVIANAIEHNDRDNPTVWVAVDRTERAVSIRVRDDGPGISHATQNSLFEPGNAGDEGIGFYLVHRIVTSHDGEVTVQDVEPRGTEVVMTLPRVSPPVRGERRETDEVATTVASLLEDEPPGD